MFGLRVLTISLLQGLSMLAAVFAVYLWAIVTDRPDDVVRSLTFATLVIGNLALILVNRSWRLSMVRTLFERRNPTLVWIVGITGVGLTLLLTVPALQRVFHFGPITWLDAGVVLAAGVLGVLWFELYKVLGDPHGAGAAISRRSSSH